MSLMSKKLIVQLFLVSMPGLSYISSSGHYFSQFSSYNPPLERQEFSHPRKLWIKYTETFFMISYCVEFNYLGSGKTYTAFWSVFRPQDNYWTKYRQSNCRTFWSLNSPPERNHGAFQVIRQASDESILRVNFKT